MVYYQGDTTPLTLNVGGMVYCRGDTIPELYTNSINVGVLGSNSLVALSTALMRWYVYFSSAQVLCMLLPALKFFNSGGRRVSLWRVLLCEAEEDSVDLFCYSEWSGYMARSLRDCWHIVAKCHGEALQAFIIQSNRSICPLSGNGVKWEDQDFWELLTTRWFQTISIQGLLQLPLASSRWISNILVEDFWFLAQVTCSSASLIIYSKRCLYLGFIVTLWELERSVKK